MGSAIKKMAALTAAIACLSVVPSVTLAEQAALELSGLSADQRAIRYKPRLALSEAVPIRRNCKSPDRTTLEAIVPIATDHGSRASGVVIDTNRVLTAAHAVEGGDRLFVRVGDFYSSADLIMVDRSQDLAVLSVDTRQIEPIRMTTTVPAQSEPVWAAGYPMAQDMSMSLGRFQQHFDGALHTSASIDSGQSGGGLLSCQNGSWHLIGMLRGFGAYRQGDHYVKLRNHSVSVAGITIKNFLIEYQ